MPLIYSFVARGTTVLADYTAYTGNFSVVAIQVLSVGYIHALSVPPTHHYFRVHSHPNRNPLLFETSRPLKRARKAATPSLHTLATVTVRLIFCFLP